MFILNIYLDDHQSALKYLKNIEANTNNVIIMVDDFNIRDSNSDPHFPYHSIHADILSELADSFNLE